MINTLIGQKTSQAQNFLQNGTRIPVTEISVLENTVLQVKTPETDKYSAVQIGFGFKKKANKAILGQAQKAHSAGSGQAGPVVAPKKIKEVRNAPEELKAGDTIKVESVFAPGDIVQITGMSKGKGFAGVVKRHGFSGGPKTHGQSDRHRAPGSIGQGTTPGRVYKGKRMAGRMGQDTVTVRNLTVVDVDAENNKLFVSGLIPGSRNSFVYITRTGENKKFVPLLSDKEDVVEEAVAEEAVEVKAEEVVAEEVKTDSGVDEIKDSTETVITPEEAVQTAPETVEAAVDAVETPAEEVKVAEEKKDVKEENA